MREPQANAYIYVCLPLPFAAQEPSLHQKLGEGQTKARSIQSDSERSSQQELSKRANRSTAMAMGEELYESEVLWPEAPHDDAPACSSSVAPPQTPSRRGVPDKLRYPASRPVDIPKPARSTRRSDEEEDDEGGRGGTMVPPHVLVSRRRSEGAAAFALRSGPGRARELSHLRNSVLRMTGFIEG